MYKVLCDNALMCDSRVEELALIDPIVKLEENKAGSFSFKIPPTHPFYDAVIKRKSVLQVYQNEELIFSGTCIEESKDFHKNKTISCEGELSYLNDSIQRPARYQGKTVRGLLEAYIANHNAQVEESKHFVVGQVTVSDPNDYISCYTNMENTMQTIKQDLVDDLGGFIRIRHENGIRYIDYLAESPNTNSQSIKIGKNLLDFSSNIDVREIATAIIPLGVKLEQTKVEGLETRLTIEGINDGIDYVYSEDAVNAYGWIYKTVIWDDVTTPEALKRKGEQYLAETQFGNMVITAKAIDLNMTDAEFEQFKLLDQILVISAPHGLNKLFRLSKMTIYLNSPQKNVITLGKDERASLSARSNQASEAIKKAIESITPANTILQSAVENATALITSAMGGYVVKNNNELLIMDTDNIETATKVWRWNINGLGYSSTGYKGPYALAMTMDGRFVADAITVDGLEVGKNVKMGADATISWEQVSNQPTIPTNNNQLQNGAGYQNASQVTQITKDTVTTKYVNALGVEVEYLKGTTISGFYINGCIITSEGEVFKSVNSEGAFRIYKGDDERIIVYASTTDGNDTGAIQIYSSNGNYMFITADGITINNEGSGGQYGNIQTTGSVFAKQVTASEWLQGAYVQASELLNGKNAQFSGTVNANDVKATNEVRGESLVCNKMGIGGGAIQNVEWVWNPSIERWCLCTVV